MTQNIKVSLRCAFDSAWKPFCRRLPFGGTGRRCRIFAMIMCFVASLSTGCVATNVPPPDRRVTIAADLGTKVYVTDVRCAKGKSDYATFQANVVNNTSSDLGVEWRVVWLDEDGIAIDTLASTWDKVMLAPGEIQALKSTSPRMDSADMRFYVRKLR